MTQSANHSVPEQGKLRRSLTGLWTFLQSLDSTSFDYTLDRIERLEREVGRLKEEIAKAESPGQSTLTRQRRSPDTAAFVFWDALQRS